MFPQFFPQVQVQHFGFGLGVGETPITDLALNLNELMLVKLAGGFINHVILFQPLL